LRNPDSFPETIGTDFSIGQCGWSQQQYKQKKIYLLPKKPNSKPAEKFWDIK
jgi:hypothetical protein